MNRLKTPVIPIILCGGSGTRLWPLSREDNPKQFMKVKGDDSLLVQTIVRAKRCVNYHTYPMIIVTLETLRQKTYDEISGIKGITAHILGEPAAHNTAAAVAYATCYARQKFGDDALLWIIPADHYIGDEDALRAALHDAHHAATKNKIVTFGITPTHANTTYGYIHIGRTWENHNNIHAIDSFIEKPDHALAQKYLEDGGYFWNSGMFVGDVTTILSAYRTHYPALLKAIEGGLESSTNTTSLMPEVYKGIPCLPFDTAIMEHIDNGVVIACDLEWSDVGSWHGIWEISHKDKKGNALSGRIACIESTDCLIQSNSLLVAAVGLSDIAIIESGDSVFVADKKNPRAMRALVSALKDMDAKETKHSLKETRPWGICQTLNEAAGYKVKEIIIHTGHMQSLHLHHQRCESVTVMKGQARIYIDGAVHNLTPQDHIFIPVGATHRIENDGPHDLVFIEVQIGAVSDDDTLRLHDIYDRPLATPLIKVSNDVLA